MAGCPYCGEMHAPLYVCAARRAAEAKKVFVGVDFGGKGATTTYRYRDPEKRKAYMRGYMARQRAKGKE